MTTKSTSEMMIDPDQIKENSDIRDVFRDNPHLDDFLKHTKSLHKIEPVPLAKYIILLYCEDTVLNVRPPMPLEERQYKAASMSKLVRKNAQPSEVIKDVVFALNDRIIFEFIFAFYTRQRNFLYQDIIALEHNMLENQKLRLRPVTEEKGDLAAFAKKNDLMKLFKEWRVQLAEYYDEFYGDNDNIRAIHKLNRENMATLENMAITA